VPVVGGTRNLGVDRAGIVHSQSATHRTGSSRLYKNLNFFMSHAIDRFKMLFSCIIPLETILKITKFLHMKEKLFAIKSKSLIFLQIIFNKKG
jgi:hypothetical protein